jgi:N-acetylmuramoyl-L-alanine amidase
MLFGILKAGFFEEKEVFELPSQNKLIVIDAGHGGWDPGKVSADGIQEKSINLDIAERLKEYLEQSGCEVILTRDSDDALSESKRDDLKLRRQAGEKGDLFISIHQNSYPDPKVKGAQTFYLKDNDEGKKLAELIQARLKELDGENTRTAKENNIYYLLKNPNPSVIAECGFLSNEEDKRNLINEQYRSKIAWQIYLAVNDYFSV